VTDAIAPSPGRRAAAYWFIDGLPEIVFGLGYLLLSVAGIATGYEPANIWTKAAFLAATAVLIVLIGFDRRIIGFFKARLTYPRTGYVRPPAEPETSGPFSKPQRDENVAHFRTRTAFIFFVAMQVVNISGAIGSGEPSRWSVPVVMAMVAAVEYLWSRSDARPYAWWWVALLALAGFLSLAWDLPPKSREFVPLVIGGAWLLAQGGWTLIHYLRANPRPADLESART